MTTLVRSARVNLRAGNNTLHTLENFTMVSLSTNVVFVEKSSILRKGSGFIGTKSTQGTQIPPPPPWFLKSNCLIVILFIFFRKDKDKTACEKCGKVVIDYVAHQVKCWLLTLFSCLNISLSFKMQENFHGTEEHPCPQCSKVFGHIAALRRHVKDNHRQFPCEHCGNIMKNFKKYRWVDMKTLSFQLLLSLRGPLFGTGFIYFQYIHLTISNRISATFAARFVVLPPNGTCLSTWTNITILVPLNAKRVLPRSPLRPVDAITRKPVLEAKVEKQRKTTFSPRFITKVLRG